MAIAALQAAAVDAQEKAPQVPAVRTALAAADAVEAEEPRPLFIVPDSEEVPAEESSAQTEGGGAVG
jgi:hypothetical protein